MLSRRCCRKVVSFIQKSMALLWSAMLLCLHELNRIRAFVDRGGLAEILCKPKILPLKSAVLEQLQKIEQAADTLDGETNQ